MPKNSTEIGQRRTYTWRGRRLPSVTTLLKGYPQEWAIAYGAKHAAERAVHQFSELARRLDSEDPVDWTLRWLKSAPHERRDAAAEGGTNLHTYLEGRLTGRIDAVPDVGPYSDYHAVEEFIDNFRPDPLYCEGQVFALADDYAGSFDLIANIYGQRLLVDLKTSNSYLPGAKKRGIGDHKDRLQLAAYRYADFIGEDDAELGPVPVLDGAAVLAIPRDDPRSWKLIEVEAGPHEYAVFLAFAKGWRWYDANKDTSVGIGLLPQVEGDAA